MKKILLFQVLTSLFLQNTLICSESYYGQKKTTRTSDLMFGRKPTDPLPAIPSGTVEYQQTLEKKPIKILNEGTHEQISAASIYGSDVRTLGENFYMSLGLPKNTADIKTVPATFNGPSKESPKLPLKVQNPFKNKPLPPTPQQTDQSSVITFDNTNPYNQLDNPKEITATQKGISYVIPLNNTVHSHRTDDNPAGSFAVSLYSYTNNVYSKSSQDAARRRKQPTSLNQNTSTTTEETEPRRHGSVK